MAVSSLGEFGLIDRLATLLGQPRTPGLLLGIGDDAAAWTPTPGTLTVATSDALVEGVHFELSTASWGDVGWKALAANLSDIAAMGCRPRYALVALGLSGSCALDDVDQLYRGMAECAAAFQCSVVGGDVVRAPCLMLQVTVVGDSLALNETGSVRPLLERSTAHVDDAIAVTGPLGGSAAGLHLLRSEPEARAREGTVATDVLLSVHRRPVPRVAAGTMLVEAGVRCGIDVSDGLLADLGHVCERSGVEAVVDTARVPVHRGATARFGESAVEMALTGGEDYELICTAPDHVVGRASALLAERGESPLVVIGSIVPAAGNRPPIRLRTETGDLLPVNRGGYQHF
ncbi:MAG: thiamine-phosphate kinase [Chloroflexi bacterium]|nr:thiamine-phosphate kinase [Chloroflexota bacterium]